MGGNNWPASIISTAAVTPTGPYEDSAASGIWELDEVAAYVAQNNWPTNGNRLPVEDVFSTYLYTGNGSSKTIDNGINLAGRGGMVWVKQRSDTRLNCVYDTARGATNALYTSSTVGQETQQGVTSFESSGFSLGSHAHANVGDGTFASWTFRKAPRFFDVVTYTGNGGTDRQISHALGQAPGMIIVKSLDVTKDWFVWHRSLSGTDYYLKLNSTDSQSNFVGASDVWGTISPTSSNFVVSAANGYFNTNASNINYVAYLFAHDTTTDGLIQCGSYTGNGSTTGPTINLGWEPQYVMIKCTNMAGLDWVVFDNMRKMDYLQGRVLYANLSNAESNIGSIVPTATGFQLRNANSNFNYDGNTYIYMAIRRGPMKTPTDATKVFKPNYRNISTAANGSFPIGFVPDLIISKNNTGTATGFENVVVQDRLRSFPTTDGSVPTAASLYLATSSTGSESTSSFVGGGYATIGSYQNNLLATAFYTTGTNQTWIDWCFKRAPGFFDVVCWTAGANYDYPSHSLKTKPELVIVKSRTVSSDWVVAYDFDPALKHNTKSLRLNTTAAAISEQTYTAHVYAYEDSMGLFYGSRTPDFSNQDVVAYLFASCPGVSKVGSYTGQNTDQIINCGFTSGARFVMIKRTDSTSDWYVWDAARGIVDGSEPYLRLNSTAAQTSADYIHPYPTGFDAFGPTPINQAGATYIYFAIA